MSKVVVTKEKLDHLANCVSAKSQEPILLSVDEMAEAVLKIKTGSATIYQDQNGYLVLGEDAAESPTVSQLSVTENGTYTAPTGVAYSSVDVNVSGGGDFSTATVTVVSECSSEITIEIPSISDDGSNSCMYGFSNISGYDSIEYTVSLYKGKAEMFIIKYDGGGVLELEYSGNIQALPVPTNEGCAICGDGTITILETVS